MNHFNCLKVLFSAVLGLFALTSLEGNTPNELGSGGRSGQLLPEVQGGVVVRPPEKADDPNRSLLGKSTKEGPNVLGGLGPDSGNEGESLERRGTLAVDPATYVVDSGDVIQVSILGAVVDQFSATVTPEGQLIIPRLGMFKASGKTFNEVRAEILARLEELFKNLTYSVTLLKPRSFKIFVLGEVNSPMAVTVSAVTPLSEIIQLAGGLRPSASRQRIAVKRRTETREYDLQKFLREGDLSQNPTVLEADVVFVPLRGEAVYIGGGVEYPGTYELRAGMRTLGELIDAAKPMKTRLPTNARIKLQRKTEAGEEVHTEIKLNELKTRAPSIALQSSDIIQFPFGNIGLAPTDADKVYVNGEVRVPGAYAYNSHMTVQDYIGLSGGLTNRANFAHAQIVKKNGVSYSLNEQVRLEPGDTLYVPEVTFKFWQDHIAIVGTLLGIFATTISITQLTK